MRNSKISDDDGDESVTGAQMDLLVLAESHDLECKAAQGRDGDGELPAAVWETYSAMANTDGGVILLGVQEKPAGQFRVLGLQDIERVRKALWDNLHNPKQISMNLLAEADVQVVLLEEKQVLRITVPRAVREKIGRYTTAMAMTVLRNPAPSAVEIANASSIVGKEKIRSIRRIITLSNAPPVYPAMAPRIVPMIPAKATDAKAIDMEFEVPFIRRL